jgi:PAS domain S-box-containing protein
MESPDAILDSSSLYVYIQIGLGILAIIGLIYKLSKAIFVFVSDQFHMMNDIKINVDNISKEMTANGGKSLKDVVLDNNRKLLENTAITEKILYKQRWVLNNAREIIFDTNQDGRIEWANKNFTKILKTTDDFIIGNNWKNFISDADREKVTSDWDDCIKEKRNFDRHFSFIDSEGNEHKVHCMAKGIKDYGYVGIVEVKE